MEKCRTLDSFMRVVVLMWVVVFVCLDSFMVGGCVNVNLNGCRSGMEITRKKGKRSCWIKLSYCKNCGSLASPCGDPCYDLPCIMPTFVS
jgi:hypothetical protein